MRLLPIDGPIPLHVNPTTGERIPSTRVEYGTEGRPPPPPFSAPSYSAARLPARLVIATKAEYARVSMPSLHRGERREWRRGSVTHFSARSRSRMLQSYAQVQRPEGPPDALFITLTYPDWYPSSVRRCKLHLAAFQRRVKREYPEAWFYWKLEFQVRGAPHFHLLMFGAGTVLEEWFHDAWFDVVKSGEHYHWFYGTDVKRLHSWREAGSYCAKYVAKEDVQQVCDSPGRFWGIANRKLRPATLQEVEITEAEFFQIRRALRRYMKQKHGYHTPGGPMSGVWCRVSAGSGKRLLEWATHCDPPNSSPPPPDAPRSAAAAGRRASGNDWSSTGAPRADQPNSSDHSGSKPNVPLFDRSDLQRARAARLLA